MLLESFYKTEHKIEGDKNITKYSFDEEARKKSLDEMRAGIKEIPIYLNKEEQAFFKNKKFPQSIPVVYSFFLNSAPNNVESYRAYHGFLSAMKGRSDTQVMNEKEIDDVVNASVDNLIQDGEKSVKSDLGRALADIYKSYLRPTKFGGHVTDTVIIPMGSTSELPRRVAKQLAKAMGISESNILDGAIIKNSWAYLSNYISGKEERFRTPKDFDISKFIEAQIKGGPIKLPPEFQAASLKLIKIKKGLHDYYKETKEFSDYQGAVNFLKKYPKQPTKELVVKSGGEYNADAMRKEKGFIVATKLVKEYKETERVLLSRLTQMSDNILSELNKSDLGPKQIAELEQQLAAMPKTDTSDSHYHKMLDYVETIKANKNQVDELQKYVKMVNDEIKQYTIGLGIRAKEAEELLDPKQLERYKESTDRLLKYQEALDKLFYGQSGKLFKIAKQRPEHRRDYSHYQLLEPSFIAKLKNKKIILVDDNVDRGNTVSDTIKSLIIAGAEPKTEGGKPAIIMFVPHILTDDPKLTKDSENLLNPTGQEHKDFSSSAKFSDLKPADATKVKEKIRDYMAKDTGMTTKSGRKDDEKLKKEFLNQLEKNNYDIDSPALKHLMQKAPWLKKELLGTEYN